MRVCIGYLFSAVLASFCYFSIMLVNLGFCLLDNYSELHTSRFAMRFLQLED